MSAGDKIVNRAPVRPYRLALWLGFRDIVHDFWSLLPQVFALAAVLTPLMLTYSLRHGVIETMLEQLTQKPFYTEITPLSHAEYDNAFFEDLRSDPRVDFVVPKIAITLSRADFLFGKSSGVRTKVEGRLLATDEGDPMLPRAAPVPNHEQVVLSSGLATALGVALGDTVSLRTERNCDLAQLELDLTVVGIAQTGKWTGRAAAIGAPLARDFEIWRQDCVAEFAAISDAQRAEFIYHNFRLYGTGLDTLRPLVDKLEGMGVAADAPYLSEYETMTSLGRGT